MREWFPIVAMILVLFFCSIWELWRVLMGVKWVFIGVINTVQMLERIYFILVC